MIELNVFPPEETMIRCRKPDGSVIEIDAIELESLSHSLFTEAAQEIPYDEYIEKMCNLFESKYNFRMGGHSMQALVNVKNDILERVKKNIYTQLEPTSTMESNQGTLESSTS